jgi:hypothetical protein
VHFAIGRPSLEVHRLFLLCSIFAQQKARRLFRLAGFSYGKLVAGAGNGRERQSQVVAI